MDKMDSLQFLQECINSIDDTMIDEFKKSYAKFNKVAYKSDFDFCPPVHPECKELFKDVCNFKINLDGSAYNYMAQSNIQYDGLGKSIQQCYQELEIAA